MRSMDAIKSSKRFVLIAALMTLSLAYPAFSEVGDNKYGIIEFGPNLGMYIPVEEEGQDVYDTGITFGVDFYLWLAKRSMGIGVNLDVFHAAGTLVVDDPPTGVAGTRAEALILSAKLSFLYRFDFEKFPLRPYIGAGIGKYFYNETLEVVYLDKSEESDSFTADGTGLHALVGLSLDMETKAKISPALFTEVRWSRAWVQDVYAEDEEKDLLPWEDIGGIAVIVGFRFAYQ